jgi:hypothetical protein
MEQYSLKKLLDESLLVKHAIAARDRVPVSPEAWNLKHLYEVHGIGVSVEEDLKVQESASKLFNTLAQLTACEPRIRVLEVMVVDDRVGETEVQRTHQSDQQKMIEIEQEDMDLVAKAEKLFREQVSVSDLDQKAVRYILPYRHAGVWHCMFRSSDSILVISVTENKEMKVTDRLWCE